MEDQQTPELGELDPSAMSCVKPAPQQCLTTKVDALSDVTRESLHSSAQKVVDDLNSKRKQDTQLLSNFKKALNEQMESACNRLEQHMFLGYEKSGGLIQEKLQKLYLCLDRIEKIESELHEFKEALKILYQDMHS
ncbi:synaptonemal complex central element protein 2-like isoform X2 [Haliotis rubra]|uniref:synaptonemal complex central element protein 2-like isoform X2 n=1 Tax=Haliotis rubra TaxID=36100 RepID=UPI001EE5E7A0|nr:synaptonemal complex central element protein 2-like isoform X2 [Haliotis rubra]